MERVIVITGASSGIGLEIAKLFSIQSTDNIVINFSRKTLKTDFSYPCDVSNLESLKEGFLFVAKKYGKIDLLINNAGYGVSGVTELVEEQESQQIFGTNFFGVLNSTKLALPLMKKGGRIINISSACAIFPLPYRSLYCASKAAVSMLSQSMRMELAPYGIDIVDVCPGDVKTNFTKNRVKGIITNHRYNDRVKKATEKLDSREEKRMPVEYVGKKIFKLANKKTTKPMYLIGTKYKIFYFFSKILPKRWFNKILENIFAGK